MKNIHYSKFLILPSLLLSLLLVMFNVAHANNDISITGGYVKESIPGNNITAAYMTINNNSDEALTLEKITNTNAGSVEMHEHTMAEGMMRMRQVKSITIAANSKVVLQPSGLHLMLFSVQQPFTKNQVATFTLYFSNKTKITMQLPVYKYHIKVQ